MGGGSIMLVETKNYKWWLPYSCSNYPTQYREVRLENKNTEKEITVDEYFREDNEESHAEFLEVQKALEELQKEHTDKRNYKAMKKDKIALAEMYGRMTKAEHDFAYWHNRAREAESFIEEMQKGFNKIGTKRGRGDE